MPWQPWFCIKEFLSLKHWEPCSTTRTNHFFSTVEPYTTHGYFSSTYDHYLWDATTWEIRPHPSHIKTQHNQHHIIQLSGFDRSNWFHFFIWNVLIFNPSLDIAMMKLTYLTSFSYNGFLYMWKCTCWIYFSDFLQNLWTLNSHGHLRRAAILDVTYSSTLVSVGCTSERLEEIRSYLTRGRISKMVFNRIWIMLHNWFLWKIRFKLTCPEVYLWKSTRRNILKEINDCQVIACLEVFFMNNGTIILFKDWVGSWRKPVFGLFLMSPLLRNKMDWPLVFLMQ